MKKIISIILALVPIFLLAQTAERQVIGSSGGFASTPGMEVSSTVGEAVVATGVSSNLILTQGFQQPGEGTFGIEDNETGLSINAYPNPAKSMVMLDLDAPNSMELNVYVHDINGTVVSEPIQKQRIIGSSSYEIDFSDLAAGNYYLLLQNSKGNLKQTIKVLKVD